MRRALFIGFDFVGRHCRLSFVVCCAVVRCLVFVVCFSLCVARCLLIVLVLGVVRCLFFVACLFVFYCSLCVVRDVMSL